jgi:hypothetical protein
LPEFPITVVAGTEDMKTTGDFFSKGPRLMRQRANRYERVHNYVQAANAAVAALPTFCVWTITEVPDVGPDGKAMSAAAAPMVSAAMHASA